MTLLARPPKARPIDVELRAFVRIDQVFRASRALAIHGDLAETERLGERNLLRIVARERRLDLGGHALAKFLRRRGTDFLQERPQQPAADGPREAEPALEDYRARVEYAVDVDLLQRRRAIAAVFLRRTHDRRFHRVQDLADELAAADRIERDRRAGGGERLGELVGERWLARVADVRCAERPEQVLLRL